MPQTIYTKRYLAVAIGLLMVVSIVNVADKELLAPVADAVKVDLNMNDAQLGTVRSMVFLAALLGQFFWGPLSDRWVRKYIIAIGATLWSLITWMTAFVTSFPALVLARASMSFAEGCFNPSSYALLTDSVPRRRHGMVLGLMSLTYPVGTAAALVVAGVIGTQNWRKPFIIYGVIGLFLGILVLWLIREPKRGGTEEVVEAGGGVYTGHFTFAELRKIFSVPTLLLAFGLDACQSSVNWSFAFWAPSYLTRYHIAPSPEAAALALLPAILGFVLGALLGGWIIDRLRKRTPLAPVWVSLIAMSGGLIAALFVFNIYRLVPLMAAAFCLGVVTYLVMPAVTIIEFNVVPPETKASTISASNIVLNLVIAVLSFLIGVVSYATQLRVAFGGAIIIMYAFGIVFSLKLLRTYQRDVARRDTMVDERVVTA